MCPVGIEAIPQAFWQRLEECREALLLLDFDGTLAPFSEERDRAAPYPGVRRRLTALGADRVTRLVLVSGRAAQEVVALLDLEPAPEIWGVHGFERRDPAGGVERSGLDPATATALDRAAETAADLLPPDRVERKTAAVAFHWRGLSSERAELARSELAARLAGSSLELRPFDGGIEARVPGIHKGSVVERLVAEAAPGSPAAYLGDDLTDEDAFAALPEDGLAILVGASPRPTLARVRLVPPEDVLAFLDRWIDACMKESRG